jgi:hypothetical protein
MKRPWTRDRMAGLERRLRDERPLPSEELVRRLSQESSRGIASFPRLRLGVATAVSGLALAVVVALGGLASPIDTAGRIVQFDNAGGSNHGHGNDGHGNNGHGNNGHHGKPSHHQYEEKITICHRPPGNPSNGQTLTLPRSGAEAHLRNHRGDSRGPCPPPPPKKPPKRR